MKTLDKLKIVGSAIALTLAFTAGHYTANIVQTDTKSETQVIKDKDTHQVTTITETKEPTGEVKRVTTIVKDTKENQVKEEKTEVKSKVSIREPKNNVYTLVGVKLSEIEKPIYGIGFNREFIGPINLGLFGMTNGTVGVTVGISF